jgi:hypothetical protein
VVRFGSNSTRAATFSLVSKAALLRAGKAALWVRSKHAGKVGNPLCGSTAGTYPALGKKTPHHSPWRFRT